MIKSITSVLLLFSALSFHAGCGETHTDPATATVVFNTKVASSVSALSNSLPILNNSRWLNIMYMAGDNDLDTFMQWYIDEINTIGADSTIQHIILRDRPGNDEVLVYTATSNYRYTLNEELNTADPGTLYTFLKLALKQSGSEQKIILSMHNHGSGVWRSRVTGTIRNHTRGWEDGSAGWDTLNGKELALAFQLLKNDFPGKKIDIFAADICSGGALELVHPLRNFARYFFGNETLGYVKSWRIPEAFSWLKKNPDATAAQLVTKFVEAADDNIRYVHQLILDAGYQIYDFDRLLPAAYDLAHFQDFYSALNTVGSEIAALTTIAEKRAVMSARHSAGDMDEAGQTDARRFLQALNSSTALPASLRSATRAALDKLTPLILCTGTERPEYCGLSIFYPEHWSMKHGSDIDYSDLPLAADAWGQMANDPPYAHDSYEDDNSMANAKLHSTGIEYRHNLYENEDWIKFNAVAKGTYSIYMYCFNNFGPMEIYNSSGQKLKSVNRSGSGSMGFYVDFNTSFTAPSAGTYYIKIQDDPAAGFTYSKCSDYTISISY